MADDNSLSSPTTPKTAGVGYIDTTRADSHPIRQLPPIKSHGPKMDDFRSAFNNADLLEKGISHLCPAHCKTSIKSIEEKTTPTSNEAHLLPSDLPSKRHHDITRNILYKLFSVYQRIFSFVLLLNLSAIIYYLFQPTLINLETLSTWSSTNFFVAILVRQDFFINILFRSAWLIPWSTPLRLRRLVARVYTYGGIHTGAAVSGTLWWLFYAFQITKTYIYALEVSTNQLYMVILSWLTLLTLLLIIIFACPHSRAISHNLFEITHRFGSWTLLCLLWLLLSLSTSHTHSATHIPIPTILLKTPTFYTLTLITAMTIHPWLHLRQWTFIPEKLSPHALRLHFTHTLPRYSYVLISTSPLLEWHPFATFPSPDGLGGGSMVISNAGDWTSRVVASPRTKYWIRNTPRAGVLSLFCIFKRVVIVTTGSGIGPTLSSIIDKPAGQVCRVVWSTRSPEKTFGAGITKALERIDPDAVVVDTDTMGRRPDLVSLAWRLYRDVQAEAVFVLSNRDVTRNVVYALEARGVPAFGPIWDS